MGDELPTEFIVQMVFVPFCPGTVKDGATAQQNIFYSPFTLAPSITIVEKPFSAGRKIV